MALYDRSGRVWFRKRKRKAAQTGRTAAPIALAADQLGRVLAHAERIERLYLQRWLATVADQLMGRELSDAAVLDAIDVADHMIGCSGRINGRSEAHGP